jgi:hypothetical protein
MEKKGIKLGLLVMIVGALHYEDSQYSILSNLT